MLYLQRIDIDTYDGSAVSLMHVIISTGTHTTHANDGDLRTSYIERSIIGKSLSARCKRFHTVQYRV